MRTALSQFSFALIILKIFTSEFYPIGALFAVYGAAVMLVAIYRRYEGHRQFFDREEEVDADDDEENNNELYHSDDESHHHGGSSSTRRVLPKATVVKKKFRTSGNSVAFLVALSLGAYVSLLVLVWNLGA